MGERVNTLKPAQLYAEVLAFENQKSSSEMTEKAIGESLIANFAKKGRSQTIAKQGFQKGKSGTEQRWEGFDKRKHCNYCKKVGHEIDECMKLMWKKQIAEAENGDDESLPTLNRIWPGNVGGRNALNNGFNQRN
jgi:hypothetical protein